MSIIRDPEANETRALEKLIDVRAKNVLEIGCGDGRMTWRYADIVDNITAIDPRYEDIQKARAELPAHLANRINFTVSSLDDFLVSHRSPEFDLAIFSWSL
jgi:ubiquinone/menaquinone biosynthesis C-methylase UbiE